MSLTSRLEHFDGATIPSGFGESLGSGASVTYGSTGYAEIDRGASGNGALLTLQEDIETDEWATVQFALGQEDADFRTGFIVADHTGGVVNANQSQSALEGETCIFIQQSTGTQLIHYNASGTKQWWNQSTGSWQGTSATIGALTDIGGHLVVQFQVDGTNQRWRLAVLSQSPADTSDRGMRYLAITTWVNWSATRGVTNGRRMAWGHHPNGAANKLAHLEYVWVNQGDAGLMHGNSKNTTGGDYEIHDAIYTGALIQAGIPPIVVARNHDDTEMIPLGTGGDTDATSIRGRSVAAKTWPLQNGDTVYCAYGGSDGTPRVHIASATIGSDLLPGTWTKDTSGTVVAGTFPYLLYDANWGRWWLFYCVVNGGAIEIKLYSTTETDPVNATWTDDGTIFTKGLSGAPDELHANQPVPYYDAAEGVWYLFYSGATDDTPQSQTVWNTCIATSHGSADPTDPREGFTRGYAPPNSIITQTNLSGAIGDLDDDPDSPDANWWTAGAAGSDTVAHVGFASLQPALDLFTGASLQELRVVVRKNASGGSDPDAQVHLYESGNGGNPLASSSVTSVTSDTGQVISLLFNASLLTDVSADDLEVRIEGTSNGGGPNARTVEVGAVQFNPTTVPLRAWDQAWGTQVNGAASATDQVTVDSTAGASEDDQVFADDSSTNSIYMLGRVRRVVSGTVLGLYQEVTLADNAPIQHAERGSPYFMDIMKTPSGFIAAGTQFRATLGEFATGSYNAACERSGMWMSSALLGPWSPAGLADPPLHMGLSSMHKLHGWENAGFIHPPAEVASQTIAVGLASEADSALATGKAKAKAAGLATEADSALAVTVTSLVPVGLATESDQAFAVASAKLKALGFASEADQGFAVGAVKTRAVGLATEADQALAIARTKTAALGLALEADQAFAVAASKVAAVGLALEADSALAVTSGATIPVGLATEADSAFAVAWSKLKALGLALEADAALALTRSKLKVLGLATETETAQAVAATKLKAAGLALEADQALALAASKVQAVGLALEADSALGVTSGTTVAVGLASEADQAFAVAASKLKAVGLALEADSAFAVLSGGTYAVGLATEADSALALAASKLRAVGLATEADQALGVTAARIIPVGLATVTDAALALAATKLKAVGLATELDVAFPVTTQGTIVQAVGLALETDSALGLGWSKLASVGLATEADSALGLTVRKLKALGLATETDIALAVIALGGLTGSGLPVTLLFGKVPLPTALAGKIERTNIG